MRSGSSVWHHQRVRPEPVTGLHSLPWMPQMCLRHDALGRSALPPNMTCQPPGHKSGGLHHEELACCLTACIAPGTAAAPGPRGATLPLSPCTKTEGAALVSSQTQAVGKGVVLTHVNGQLPLLQLCGAVWLQHPPRVGHPLHDAMVHLLQGQEEVILQAPAGAGNTSAVVACCMVTEVKGLACLTHERSIPKDTCRKHNGRPQSAAKKQPTCLTWHMHSAGAGWLAEPARWQQRCLPHRLLLARRWLLRGGHLLERA